MRRPSRVRGLAAALPILAAAFAAGAAPPPPVTVSAWAASTRVVAAESGSPFPGKWSNETTPYLVEIMDCLSLSHPAREIAFKKAAQIAGSEAGLNLIGTVIDKTPAPVLVVLPSLDEGKKYVKLKLQPTIDETPALKAKVREQKSRDEDSSTTSLNKFRGGFLQVTGANSAKGLKMLSARVLVAEEVTEFPLDVDNQGDPLELAYKRLTAWSGREKIFLPSTPGIKGMCRVSAKYEASDQRHYHVPCPQCGAPQVLEWKQLKFKARTSDEVDPAQVFYECAANGCVIEHHRKKRMLAAGKWIARHPDQGRQPGFHLNQLYSPFVTWADTVRAFLDAKDNPTKLKVFVQQVLGEEWEAKGDAPEWEKLYARREEYPLAKVPPGGLVLTMGVDVQKNYLVFEVVAWGVGKATWSLEIGIIEGDTTSLETWGALSEVGRRQYPDAKGNLRAIDVIAVDAGYNTQWVYAWARGHARRMAVKGMPGHLHPALGTPTPQEVTWGGKKRKRGVMLWPVGTWTLKAELYGNLAKQGPADPGGPAAFELGSCHFSLGHDERYFQQLTAESLLERRHGSRTIREWVESGDNHFLDARVYAMAAAEHLGISTWSPAKWQEIVALRSTEPEQAQQDLAALWSAPAPPKAPDAPDSAANLKSPVPIGAVAAAPAPIARPAVRRPIRGRFGG